MFNSKKNSLFPTNKGTQSTASAFVAAAMKKSHQTTSGNGALKYDSSGDDFVDQFNNLGVYKAPRSFSDIEKDSETLWANNKLLTVIFLFYVRMITRVTNIFGGGTTSVSQKGAELKHEGIFRMIWLAIKQPETFKKNMPLFISVGSWKDVFTMLSYDLQYNGWDDRKLDWEYFGTLITSGLADPGQSELVKKYLPQIRANSKCTTLESQADNIIAKWICSLIFGNKEIKNSEGNTYKAYRKLKSSGTAHEWQKLISQRKFTLLDFSKIHGRALKLLSRSKFLKNQGLEQVYEQWITKPEIQDVKFTGYVHELFSKLPRSLSGLSKGEQETINKQFNTLVSKGGETEGNATFIVCRDTSGSMSSTALGTKMTSNNIAKSLALYFSAFLKGPFKDAWIEFDSSATMRQWKGNTVLEKWYNDRTDAYGSTNFQGVIDLFCTLKKQGVKESDFPTGILCVSDGEFNPSDLGKPNVNSARIKLQAAGFSKEYCDAFTIVLWNIPNTFYGGRPEPKFETFGDVKNVFYMSGYSASQVSFLMTGKVESAKDLFLHAMNQEVLGMIEL